MAGLTRRSALIRLFGAAAAAPFGLQALVQGTSPANAQQAPGVSDSDEPPPTGNQPGCYFYSLSGPDDGPLSTGKTRSDSGNEIGHATFADGTFVLELPYPQGRSQEWIGSRDGTFSIGDGAL